MQSGAAIVTKDEDFASRAMRAVGGLPPVIIWLRVGNTTNRVLREWIEPRLAGIAALLVQGHRMVEVI